MLHYIFLKSSIFIFLQKASINRSPTSYLANPAEERARYSGDLDTEMVQLTFTDLQGEPRGVLNWFSVHPNSMNNTNHFISGDNKGAARSSPNCNSTC